MSKLGLYLHVPFCDGKCPYCDFYSLKADGDLMDRYVQGMEAALAGWGAKSAAASGAGQSAYAGGDAHAGDAAGGRTARPCFAGDGLRGEDPRVVQTVYFGGGTPNLLGAERLARLLEAVRRAFSVLPDAEITTEANPTQVDAAFFRDLREAGFNRVSMGLQSAQEEELRLLGRKHTARDVERAVAAARQAGFENISLDLMLGLPGGSRERLRSSIDFAAGLGVEHISSYLLKVEEGTPFAARGIQVPEDDETADQYLFCVDELAKRGYAQYEISNFSKPGRESRHNLVYWRGEEYLGLGPGAHSFYGVRRFFYPRDLKAFLEGSPPRPDGEGGSPEEFAMLNLRLTRGLRREDCRARFGAAGERMFETALGNAKKCPPGLVRADEHSIFFTPEGFLVSNALILRLLPEIP